MKTLGTWVTKDTTTDVVAGDDFDLEQVNRTLQELLEGVWIKTSRDIGSGFTVPIEVDASDSDLLTLLFICSDRVRKNIYNNYQAPKSPTKNETEVEFQKRLRAWELESAALADSGLKKTMQHFAVRTGAQKRSTDEKDKAVLKYLRNKEKDGTITDSEKAQLEEWKAILLG